MEMMSNQRGYLPKDLPKFPHEAVIPYKAYHRQVSSRPDSLPIRDISNIEFWATGVDYLKQDTQEFRESLDKLKVNFLNPLAKPATRDGGSSSAEQIEFLLAQVGKPPGGDAAGKSLWECIQQAKVSTDPIVAKPVEEEARFLAIVGGG